MLRRAGLALIAVGVFAACGSAQASSLEATAKQMDEINSGEIRLRYAATADGGEAVGFEVEGPFALPEREGEMVTADLTFTRLLGDTVQERRFIATEGRAWVEVDGTLTEVPADALSRLRAGPSSGDPLSGLRFDEWVDDARTVSGPNNTEVITGDVDAVAAFNDLAAMAASFGAGEGAGALTGEDAEALRRAVRSSTIRLVTGAEDHILRSLRVVISLAADAPEQLMKALGPLAGLELVLDVELDHADQPVKISPPV